LHNSYYTTPTHTVVPRRWAWNDRSALPTLNNDTKSWSRSAATTPYKIYLSYLRNPNSLPCRNACASVPDITDATYSASLLRTYRYPNEEGMGATLGVESPRNDSAACLQVFYPFSTAFFLRSNHTHRPTPSLSFRQPLILPPDATFPTPTSHFHLQWQQYSRTPRDVILHSPFTLLRLTPPVLPHQHHNPLLPPLRLQKPRFYKHLTNACKLLTATRYLYLPTIIQSRTIYNIQHINTQHTTYHT
jgi:hypothetical protein